MAKVREQRKKIQRQLLMIVNENPPKIAARELRNVRKTLDELMDGLEMEKPSDGEIGRRVIVDES